MQYNYAQKSIIIQLNKEYCKEGKKERRKEGKKKKFTQIAQITLMKRI